LTALKTEIKDVMEDLWTMLLIGLNKTVFQVKMLIHIMPEIKHAKNSLQYSKMEDLLMYQNKTHLK
jgi:hypothetical protein